MNNTQLNQELKLQAFVNNLVSLLTKPDVDMGSFIFFQTKQLLKDFGVKLDDETSMKEYLNRVAEEPTNLENRILHGETDLNITVIPTPLNERIVNAYQRYTKLQSKTEVFSQVTFICSILKRIFWTYNNKKPFNVEGGKPSLETLKKDVVNRRDDLTDDEYKALTEIIKGIKNADTSN